MIGSISVSEILKRFGRIFATSEPTYNNNNETRQIFFSSSPSFVRSSFFQSEFWVFDGTTTEGDLFHFSYVVQQIIFAFANDKNQRQEKLLKILLKYIST